MNQDEAFSEAVEAAELARQREADRFAQFQAEAAHAELAAGLENVVEQVEDDNTVDPAQRNWADIPIGERTDILFHAVGELGGRLQQVEESLLTLGQAFVRAIESSEAPKMVIPGQHATHRTRRSR